jgi:phenylpyruvate tautomerase PptA (4-oxalocrotonate tautomerase family)
VARIKVYGLGEHLDQIKSDLSGIIHSCVVDALSYPPEKRFHRFFPLSAEDFYYPEDRSARYIIIDIAMFEGRSVEAKKHLLRLLFERARDELDLEPRDLEITITETPRHDWGIRGQPGDELNLGYSIDP